MKPKMCNIWSWFLFKSHIKMSSVCHNENSKLCNICQDECILAKGHCKSDKEIEIEWKEIINKNL